MAPHTKLFILFPEYPDPGQPASLPYIAPQDIPDASEMEELIAAFNRLIKFISHENYQGYYDINNVNGFSKPLELLEECYPNNKRTLRSAINKWEDWHKAALPEPDPPKTYYFHSIPIQQDLLYEIIKHKASFPDLSILVINHNAIDCNEPQLPVFNEKVEQEDIYQCKCYIKNIHSWFEKNRKPKRVFNFNKKHGENGTGNEKGESILMCSCESAQDLLHKAVGLTPSSHLFYFDHVHSQYIEFRNERTLANSFHGFHITSQLVNHRIKKEIQQKIKLLIE